MFTEDDYETRKDLYFVYNNLLRSVKDKRYKLIEYRNYIRKTELFDLVSDPDEIHNLADDGRYADVRERLTELLLSYRQSWGDERHPFGRSYWENF